MGVPAFFKWLTQRCPKILHDGREEEMEPDDEGEFDDKDIRIDNLYLDMNGIIHPCTHPENLPIPKPLNEAEMFNNIFKYIDKIVSIARPRKLIYFAVDGVAPRAKMNQQRGRRFRAALDSIKIAEKKERLKQEWADKGMKFPEAVDENLRHKFDSNTITPGTPFMDRLTKAIQYFITERMNTHPRYKNIKCILSDASVPGEGEHKILDFLRQQRALDDYNANTSHCLYGADADLIMLGLSTHEPYFYILRETIMQKHEKKCTICGQQGHMFNECKAEEAKQESTEGTVDKKDIPVNFQFVKLHVFREYLDYEFKYFNTPFPYNLERVIDDFVFMCFFCGNDFLPNLPVLNIREGGIDILLYLYKRVLPYLGGHFIENGEINLMRIDVFLRQIGDVEEAILKSAARDQEYHKKRNLANEAEKAVHTIFDKKKVQTVANERNRTVANQLKEEIKMVIQAEEATVGSTGASLTEWKAEVESKPETLPQITKEPSNQAMEEEKLPANVEKQNSVENPSEDPEGMADIAKKIVLGEPVIPELAEEDDDPLKALQNKPEKELTPQELFQKELQTVLKTEAPLPEEDDLRLGDSGFKRRYYGDKFKIGPDDFPEFRGLIQQSYVEALCWIFAYYYKGCISWNWYYPFHYTPFASDITGIDKLRIAFTPGEPFRPFDQLMAVLPPYSGEAIPTCLRHLMTDPNSDIIDFYPTDFHCDTKGKRFAWMGENILPMIDEERLIRNVRKHDMGLTREEVGRNKRGDDLLYMNVESATWKALKEKVGVADLYSADTKVYTDYHRVGLGGTLMGYPDSHKINQNYKCPPGCDAVEDIKENEVIAMRYQNPTARPHNPNLLEGVIMPKAELSDEMFEYIDKRFYSGNRIIKLLERTLGIANDHNERFNRGMWNDNTEEVNRKTQWGNQAHNRDSGQYNQFFNNNKGHFQEVSQFKNIPRQANPHVFNMTNPDVTSRKPAQTAATQPSPNQFQPLLNQPHDGGRSGGDRYNQNQGHRHGGGGGSGGGYQGDQRRYQNTRPYDNNNSNRPPHNSNRHNNNYQGNQRQDDYRQSHYQGGHNQGGHNQGGRDQGGHNQGGHYNNQHNQQRGGDKLLGKRPRPQDFPTEDHIGDDVRKKHFN
jgi:5'-3' exoribonuclease 2